MALLFHRVCRHEEEVYVRWQFRGMQARCDDLPDPARNIEEYPKFLPTQANTFVVHDLSCPQVPALSRHEARPDHFPFDATHQVSQKIAQRRS